MGDLADIARRVFVIGIEVFADVARWLVATIEGLRLRIERPSNVSHFALVPWCLLAPFPDRKRYSLDPRDHVVREAVRGGSRPGWIPGDFR